MSIYVVSYLPCISNFDNFKFIQLKETNYPLQEIIKILNPLSNNDKIILLNKKIEKIDIKLIERLSNVYIDDYKTICMGEDDNINNPILASIGNVETNDIIMLGKRHIRSGLRDISRTSSYQSVRKKLIKLCSGNKIWMPNNRKPETKQPEKANTSPSIDNSFIDDNVVIKNNLKEYRVKINLGIGDILIARGILDAQKENYDKVYVSIDYKTYERTRQPKQVDKDFTYQLLDMVFKPPYYCLEKSETDYPHRYGYTFHTIDKFPLIPPNMSGILCEGKSLNIGPYITVSTRVREIPIKEYEKDIKKKFLDSLIKLSEKYKIVIIGERELVKYPEHDFLKERIFTLYNDLIKTLPSNRVVDLSFSNINNIKNRMESFKQVCMYMRDADWNIILGNGGDGCISISIGNTIGYFTRNNTGDPFPFIFDNQSFPGIHYTSNLNLFFDKLKDILKNKPIYKRCVNIGVGDLIMIRGELDRVKDKYSKVEITPNGPFFNKIRSKDYVNGFIKEYIELLFKPPYYCIGKNFKSPKRDAASITSIDNIPLASPQHLKELFCVGKSLEIGPYVTISTKVRVVNKNSYQEKKSEFYSVLNKVANKYKIVIIGDKTLPNWREFKMFDDIFVIYDDIIKNIPKEKLVDLTFDSLDSGSLSHIQQDCVYMRDAVNNIIIGAAGCWWLAVVSGKITAYYEPNSDPHYNDFVKVKSDAYLTKNFNKFLLWCENI